MTCKGFKYCYKKYKGGCVYVCIISCVSSRLLHQYEYCAFIVSLLTDVTYDNLCRQR